jgi:hypothetical protein
MQHATAGFAPMAVKQGYLTGKRTFDATLTQTSSSALFVGLGFTTGLTAATATTAVGVTRDGACTESFAGGSVRIWSDSISVFKSGPLSVLHPE